MDATGCFTHVLGQGSQVRPHQLGQLPVLDHQGRDGRVDFGIVAKLLQHFQIRAWGATFAFFDGFQAQARRVGVQRTKQGGRKLFGRIRVEGMRR